MDQQEYNAIVTDFIEWSGGFGIEECDAREVQTFIDVNEIPADVAKVIWEVHGSYVSRASLTETAKLHKAMEEFGDLGWGF